MPTFTILPGFLFHEADKVHDLGADTLTVALSNTAPGSESTPVNSDTAANCVLANVTQVSYTYCSSRVITTTSITLASSVVKLVLQDLTLTATGGAVGPFRYIYIYNDTATNDELIGYIDYGDSITLNDTEYIILDFSAANGVLQKSIG